MYLQHFKRMPLKLFDVTLRDGLQSIPKMYSLIEKKDMLCDIINTHKPAAIEIGSIVSPKILPQMADSIELYNTIISSKDIMNSGTDIYMLTPSIKGLKIAHDNNVKNFSFITSVSTKFQEKNINKTLDETKYEIKSMMDVVANIEDTKVKLYISCISECPIFGVTTNINIVDEILYYYYTHDELDEICLSDTCATLEYVDFKIIIDELIKRKIDINKISLHLHNQPLRYNNLRNILIYAMKKGIYRYDVSNIPEIGGCTVTMNSTNGNLSYDQIYSSQYSMNHIIS